MSHPDPDMQMRQAPILWAALLGSQVIYLGMAASGVARVRSEPLDLPVLPLVLGALAVVCGFGAQIFWRRATGAGRPIHASPEPAAPTFVSYLIAWVLDEAIAIFGLVLAFLAFPLQAWAPFFAAAFVLTLLHRPTSASAG